MLIACQWALSVLKIQKKQDRKFLEASFVFWGFSIKKDIKRSVNVNLGGQQLSLKTNCGEDMLAEILSYVEDRFNQSLDSVKSKSVERAAILTALNIAEERFLLKENYVSELTSIENSTKNIIATLKSSIEAS